MTLLLQYHHIHDEIVKYFLNWRTFEFPQADQLTEEQIAGKKIVHFCHYFIREWDNLERATSEDRKRWLNVHPI